MPRTLRASTRRSQFADLPVPESVQAQPVQTFQLLGHNKTLPASRLPDGVARLVRNLRPFDGAYQLRDATSAIGTASAGDLLHAMEAILTTGLSYPVRFGNSGVEVYSGGAWVATGGAAWSPSSSIAPFAVTGWSDTIVFASDTNGIYSLAFTAGFPKTLLTPLLGVIHLATFANRIIASTASRIQWSVSRNNADWAGIGSGYEDLLSSPGGRPDSQTAVIPVSDDSAIVVRSQSFWIMSQTGSFDAPFAFSQMFAGQGSRFPRTCVSVPRGAMCLGDAGSVWLVTLDGTVKDVGVPVSADLNSTPDLLRLATAAYDPKNNEYRLSIPSTSYTSGTVYRYNLTTDTWTEDLYPFSVRSVSYALYAQMLTVDELVGTVDDLVGAVDDLITGVRRAQMMFSMRGTPRLVAQEDYTQNVNASRDIASTALRVATPWRLETGPVRRGNVLTRNEIVQLVLEYIATSDNGVTFEWGDTNSDTWTTLSARTASASTRPALLAVDMTIDREEPTLAISSASGTTIRLIDLFAMTREAGYRVDAR